MSATAEAKKRALNALSCDTMKLHTGYPGLTGANEVSGGTPAYTSKAITYGVSTAGEARQIISGATTFDVPPCTVRWVTVWDSANMLFVSPNGGAPREFSAELASNVLTVPAHGWADDDPIVFYMSTPPAGLTAGTVYYVINSTVDTFQVSATVGGAAINLTAQAADDCVVSKITETVYAAQDTHTISAFPIGAPF
jgi:hypothetical protein